MPNSRRRTGRTKLRRDLPTLKVEALEDRRLLASDFGDAPDSIVGTSRKGVFEEGAEFRITDVTPNGDTTFNTNDPAVAFDPDLNQYLVVYNAPRFYNTSNAHNEEPDNQTMFEWAKFETRDSERSFLPDGL